MRKIRAVIDTNVFVSGAISPKGSPRRILEMAKKKIFETVTSPSINQEILSVLHRDNIYAKYGINEDIVDGIASFLYEGTILTEGFYQVSRIKQDPEDNKFIGCAISFTRSPFHLSFAPHSLNGFLLGSLGVIHVIRMYFLQCGR